jgi:hypothetical protein
MNVKVEISITHGLCKQCVSVTQEVSQQRKHTIARIPIKLNGAKEDRFFIRQSGSKTIDVKP